MSIVKRRIFTEKCKNILFVCTGNTCRSPMAEGFFNKIAKERKINCKASSAGLSTTDGLKASDNAIIAAQMLGADISLHKSRMINSEIVGNADEIFLMNYNHYGYFINAFPNAKEKTFILGKGISDPYGGNIEIYSECAGQILKAVSELHFFNNI